MICTLHMSYFYWGQIWVGTPKMKSGYHRTTLNIILWSTIYGNVLSQIHTWIWQIKLVIFELEFSEKFANWSENSTHISLFKRRNPTRCTDKKERRKKGELCFGLSWAQKLTFGPYNFHNWWKGYEMLKDQYILQISIHYLLRR